MNQSELIEKVAQATELNQAAAGHAVKAVVNAILDALLAGDAVRVSGLGIFNVAARPAREGRNPQPERPSRSQPARQCGSTPARPSKMPSIRRLRRRLLGRSLHHQRNPRCGSKRPLDVWEGRDRGKFFGHPDLGTIAWRVPPADRCLRSAPAAIAARCTDEACTLLQREALASVKSPTVIDGMGAKSQVRD
jgi:nucleoid DNA-binding protein